MRFSDFFGFMAMSFDESVKLYFFKLLPQDTYMAYHKLLRAHLFILRKNSERIYQ
jgi:hypothetical protein